MDATNFSRLDYALGQFLAQRATLTAAQKPEFAQLVARLNNGYSNGHSCLLVKPEEQVLLQASNLVSSDQQTPLILERDQLYLHRYWHYEQRLAEQIIRLTAMTRIWPNLEALLDQYFPETAGQIDWQREAVRKSVSQSFSVITGGPGTGKTTTVVKLLAIMLALNEQSMHIALVAPTGKAAMRLQAAVVQNKQRLPCSETVMAKIPETVTTIHRLLGAKLLSPYFTHHQDNPLPYDLVVVDEASMVDLALMSKLIDALPEHAKIILLGDKDQLASVESGAVLANITTALPDHAHVLHTAYRFNSQIKALADAVNQQNSTSVWDLLIDKQQQNIGLLDQALISYITAQLQDYWSLVHTGADFKAIITEFSRFQVLCANRLGPNSVSDINSRVTQQFLQQSSNQAVNQWYQGRAIMVTRNQASMQLYNGDIGICLRDQQSGRLMVYFERPDGRVQTYLPSRLPECETVFAMTIHKSQGSEFKQILIVLPEQLNPLLTKELIYTAITRARDQVLLFTSQAVLFNSLKQKVARVGGLERRLRGEESIGFYNLSG